MSPRDYGREGDPFANVRASEEFGIPAWLGAVLRGNDKVSRLRTYAQTGTLDTGEASFLNEAADKEPVSTDQDQTLLGGPS